ncbi:hypothetical protein RB195_002140 [Necator americanus]|uniref:NYN domain-containing protein n=1 Tax=Necator americanus TaxID=51031 RepID=A0ABR1DHU5_NECAM
MTGIRCELYVDGDNVLFESPPGMVFEQEKSTQIEAKLKALELSRCEGIQVFLGTIRKGYKTHRGPTQY